VSLRRFLNAVTRQFGRQWRWVVRLEREIDLAIDVDDGEGTNGAHAAVHQLAKSRRLRAPDLNHWY